MFKKLKDIKKKIRLAKVWAIIFGIIFLGLVINSICLTYKVHKLSKNSNHICEKYNDHNEKSCGKYEGKEKCENH